MTILGRHEHDRALELAAMAIDLELSHAESTEFESQIAACPSCSHAAVAMRADADALRGPMTLLPSRRVDEAVYGAIAGHRAGPPRALLMTAAALLLLAVLAALAVGASLLVHESLPVTVVPTDRVAVVSPVPDASVPAVATEAWQELATPAGAETGRLIEAVAIEGTGLVGVGRGGCVPEGTDPTDCYAAAWTAGADWSLTDVPVDDTLSVGTATPTSGPEKGIFDLASGPDGIVAIGYPYDLQVAAQPVVWRSPDGRAWQRIQFMPPTEGVRVSAVTASELGYVMVGWAMTGTGGAITARAAAWVSGDGLTWTRADDTAAMDVGACLDTLEEPSCGGMLGVSPNEEGFLAVGSIRTGVAGDAVRPAAWTSPDGLRWTRSDTDRLDFTGWLTGVARGPAGPVAVGTMCQPDCGPASQGVTATSADGTTWDSAPVVGAAALEAITSTSGEVFAVGAREADGSAAAELQVWRSDDGVAWRRMIDPPPIAGVLSYRALDLAATAHRVVVVGWASTNSLDSDANFAYAVSVGGPAIEPAPSPVVTSSPGAIVASSIDPVVALRVEIRPDVSVGRTPLLTVYQDGTVLRRGDEGATTTRLDADGLARVVAKADDSGLFGTSGALGRDPSYEGGTTTYSIELRRGPEIIRRSTENSMAPATRAEAERIIALAEHLADLEAWLPADAWASGPAAAAAYVATHDLLKVTTFKQPGVDYPPQAMDRADVVWPLPGTLEGFGDVAEDQPMGAGTSSRCGVLTSVEAAAVERALVGAPWASIGERMEAELDWSDVGHVTVSLIALLPDDPPTCETDRSWP